MGVGVGPPAVAGSNPSSDEFAMANITIKAPAATTNRGIKARRLKKAKEDLDFLFKR